MKLNTLHDVYLAELRDLYSAENQLLKALPKMVKAASSPELKTAFENHLEETRGQVDRLTEVFKGLGEKPTGKKCKAMEGLIAEGKEIIDEDGEPSAKDAALISAAQKVEHYEIAGYGCVCTYARLMGETDAAELLQESLDEEKAADETLTGVAESTVNPAAEDEGDETSAPRRNGRAPAKPRAKALARR